MTAVIPHRSGNGLPRSAAAVLAGSFMLVVSVAIKFWLIRHFVPEALPEAGEDVFPSTGWLLALLGSDIALMIAAGYITARLARRRPIAHAVGLGSLMVAFGLTWMLVFRGWLPLWYQVVLVSIAIPAAATGGTLAQSADVRSR